MEEILFLAHRMPFPPNRGDKIRSFNILKHIAGHARVHLGCFADDAGEAAHLPALREALDGQLGEGHVEVRRSNRAAAARALLSRKPLSPALFESAGLRSFVAEVVRRPSIAAVYAFSSQMAQFVPADVEARFLMDFADVDSAKFAAYAEDGAGPIAWIYRREGRHLLRYERSVAERADISFFVSEAEARLFRNAAGLGSADIRALENGVDLAFYDPEAGYPRLGDAERGTGPLILFTGQMDYRPNVDAVTSFSKSVMPLILAEQPQARFAIMGRSPTAEVRRLHGHGGTIVIGAVEDVRSWLGAANVVVAPLRIARGVQNKVLEAMAMAKAVVATPQAFEGIDAVAGQDLLVVESPASQAKAVLRLLSQPATAHEMGAAARRRVETNYSWESRLAGLIELLRPPVRRNAA